MGSGGIVRDLPGIEALGANLWPFPSVISCGGFVSVPNLGKEFIEGKEEEPPPASIALNRPRNRIREKTHKKEAR